ncbi:Hypp8562 [Branchiostoma lanceolatum]|uniref:Hypp8562 protein n=1 Tax=Branchiostoma lanceolatum TaxID=7740 RepID=A0A8J9Z8T1_BRALA|nr:Hypp8562 [Branchiostoma lanceolatum]
MANDDENTRCQPTEVDENVPTSSTSSGDSGLLLKGGGDTGLLAGRPGEVEKSMRDDTIVERAHADVPTSTKNDNCDNQDSIRRDTQRTHDAGEQNYGQQRKNLEFLDHAKKLQEEVKKQSSLIENLLSAKRQLQTELQQILVRENHYRERAEYLEEKIQAISSETEETREQAKEVMAVHDKLQGQIEWLTQARDRAHRIKTTAMREKHRIQQELKLEQAKMDEMTIALREAKKQKLVADRRRIEMARYKDDLTKALEKERSRSTALLESIETLKIQMIEAMKVRDDAVQREASMQQQCARLRGMLRRDKVQDYDRKGCVVLDTTEWQKETPGFRLPSINSKQYPKQRHPQSRDSTEFSLPDISQHQRKRKCRPFGRISRKTPSLSSSYDHTLDIQDTGHIPQENNLSHHANSLPRIHHSGQRDSAYSGSFESLPYLPNINKHGNTSITTNPYTEQHTSDRSRPKGSKRPDQSRFRSSMPDFPPKRPSRFRSYSEGQALIQEGPNSSDIPKDNRLKPIQNGTALPSCIQNKTTDTISKTNNEQQLSQMFQKQAC